MAYKYRGMIFAISSAVVLVTLGGFLALDLENRWGSASLARILSAAAAWVTAWALTQTMAVEQRRGWLPWAHLAATFYALALIDTAIVYFRVILGVRNWLYLFSLLEILPMLSLIGGCLRKAMSLRTRFFNTNNILVVAVVLAVTWVLYVPSLLVVLSSPRVPAIAVTLSFLPVFYIIALVIAVYIATSFGRGVVGRPWDAIAVGVFLLALGQFFSLAAACRRQSGAVYLAASHLCVIGGYLAIGWGALYHHAILSEGRRETNPHQNVLFK